MLAKICCLAGTVALLFAQNVDTKKLAADAQQSVVQIVFVNNNQLNPIGTGFFVGRGNLIATAAHVYLDGSKTVVDGQGGMLFLKKKLRTGAAFLVPFELVKADYQHDLAVLRFDPEAVKKQIPGFEIKTLELDDNKPSVGDGVVFVGYFGGDEFPLLSRTVVAGFTTAPLGAPPLPEQVVLDLPANPGQSGSPVLSLESGRVIGILASFVPVTLFPGSLPIHSGLSRSVEAEHLKRLIESADVR
jgi:serine protease Do